MSMPTPPRRPPSCARIGDKCPLCFLDQATLEELEKIIKRSYRNTWCMGGSLLLLCLGLFVMAWY